MNIKSKIAAAIYFVVMCSPANADVDSVARGMSAKAIVRSFGASILEFGAKSDGSADATAAFTAAIAAQPSGVCSIVIPAGTFLVRGPVVVNRQCAFHFAGRWSTTIQTDQTTGDLFQLTVAQSSMTGGAVVKSTVTRTSGDFIKCDAIRCQIEDLYMDKPYIGIEITNNGTLSKLERIEGRSPTPDTTSTGSACIAFTGTGSGADSVTIDNPICATDLTAYTAGILMKNGTATIINAPHLLQAVDNISMVPGSGQSVLNPMVYGGFLDSHTHCGLNVNPTSTGNVARVFVSSSWLGTSGNCGAYLKNSGSGTVSGFTFENDQFYAGTSCVDQEGSGVSDINISGGYCSGVTIGVIANGATRLNVHNVDFGNIFGLGVALTQPIQFYGASTAVTITNNKFYNFSAGSALAGLNFVDNTSSRITDNFGYNPVGASTITVGASPYTYTASQSPETVYISGGTVSSIVQGGQTLFSATGATVQLNPNESVVVTYSVLPTMKKVIH